MYFKQITVEGLGCFSYIVGCPRAKAMAVIDPKRDIQDYLDIARDEGMAVTHVINTHVHADHVSGDQELKAATGAAIHIFEGSPVTYPHKAMKDGEVIQIGMARMEVLHTPGHTPHAISLVVTDLARSQSPEMVLTGDLLFVGDVGRPDLAGAEVLEEQIRNLYNSLYVKLASYPDHLEVFPAHGQGSLCGRGMSAKPSSTLGFERRANPMLGFDSFEAFRREVTSAYPLRPKSFSHIIATNKKGAGLLEACPLERGLSPEQFQQAMDSEAVVIDVRSGAAFGGFHVPGSLNIGFEKQLANWVGMVVSPDKDLLLVVEDRADYERMVTELHRIGYDRIQGYLSGGVLAWVMEGRPVEQLGQVGARQVQEELATGDIQVVDVRTRPEWEGGRIKGAVHFPLTEILDGKLPVLSKTTPIVTVCGSGYRSNIAGSALQGQGFTRVRSMAGGMLSWSNAGLAVDR